MGMNITYHVVMSVGSLRSVRYVNQYQLRGRFGHVVKTPEFTDGTDSASTQDPWQTAHISSEASPW